LTPKLPPNLSARSSRLGDGARQPIPTVLFYTQLFLTCFRELVELSSPACLIFSPLATNPLFLLNTVERWIERALLNRQHLVRHSSYSLNNAVAVQGPERKCFKDQHVECALEKISFGISHVSRLNRPGSRTSDLKIEIGQAYTL